MGSSSHLDLPAMPSRTSDELRATVIRLLVTGRNPGETAELTGLHERTVKSIYSTWEATGSVSGQRDFAIVGRPRKLSLGDVWVNEHISEAIECVLTTITSS